MKGNSTRRRLMHECPTGYRGNQLMIGKVLDCVDAANRPRELSKIRPDHSAHQGSKEARRRLKQLAKQRGA